ncbi:MAG: FAD-dependent oxidoreductase, partial [Acetobacteraceae bacterium]|nr:FAD-dependent oxidoreductase [Acetobacteraceae bacterium]
IRAEGEALRAALREAGARPWPDPERLVGVPGMSALPRALAAGLDVTCGVTVARLAREAAGWFVEQDGPFDGVLLTVPAPQAIPLAPAFAEPLSRIRYAPCWTAMLIFPERLPLPDTLRPDGHAIGWAARDSSKPGRDATQEAWVVQAGPAFSRAHLEETPEAVLPRLLAAFADLAGLALPAPGYAAAHRWRYSLLEAPLGEPCLWDPALGLGYASDGCLGGRVEAAWDSGAALAAAIG